MALFRPAKPKAKAVLSADVSLPAGENVIPVDLVVWGEGQHGWTGTSSFRPDKAGLYLCTGSVCRAPTASAGALQVKLFVNGVQAAHTPTIQYPTSGGNVGAQISEPIPLEVADQLELVATLHATIAATAKANLTSLSIVRIGPERWT